MFISAVLYALAETHVVCDDVTSASPFWSCQVYIPSMIHISKRIYLIFICLYTLWAAAVNYKSSPKNRNPRLCNFSRDCIFKIAHGHLCLCVCHSRYPGNTGSLYAHHTLTDNLPRCDDGKKLGSNLIKRLKRVKFFRLITCVNALKLTPLIYIYIYCMYVCIYACIVAGGANDRHSGCGVRPRRGFYFCSIKASPRPDATPTVSVVCSSRHTGGECGQGGA